jgi:3-oxoacyl-[acyl-carrier protein] reductase
MKSGGSIVSVASAGGEMPFPRLGGYGMTKAAVIQLTRTASVEFGELGIRVNAIAPGYVETPMVAASYSRADGTIDEALKAQFFDARRSQSPLSITGEPLDIALTVLYLLSDASKFMTGQVLRPNGGVYFG